MNNQYNIETTIIIDSFGLLVGYNPLILILKLESSTNHFLINSTICISSPMTYFLTKASRHFSSRFVFGVRNAYIASKSLGWNDPTNFFESLSIVQVSKLTLYII